MYDYMFVKVPTLIITMTESWSGFCNQTGTLMAADPSLTFTPDTFLTEICQLDPHALTQELLTYQVSVATHQPLPPFRLP